MGHLMLHGLDTPAELSRLRGLATYLHQTYLQKVGALNGGQGAEHVLLSSHALQLMQQAAHLPQLVGELPSVLPEQATSMQFSYDMSLAPGGGKGGGGARTVELCS